MNVCSKCGTLNEDIDKYCKKCGNEMASFTAGSVMNEGDAENAKIKLEKIQEDEKTESKGIVLEEKKPEENVSTVKHKSFRDVTEFGMKWFKFMIWVLLPLNMLLSIKNAIWAFTGYHYGYSGEAQYFYSFFGDGLKALDIFMAICAIVGTVILGIFWKKLFDLKSDWHKWFVILTVFNIVVNVIYTIGILIIAGDFLKTGSTYSLWRTCIQPFVFYIINITYFKNRSSLFVN